MLKKSRIENKVKSRARKLISITYVMSRSYLYVKYMNVLLLETRNSDFCITTNSQVLHETPLHFPE